MGLLLLLLLLLLLSVLFVQVCRPEWSSVVLSTSAEASN